MEYKVFIYFHNNLMGNVTPRPTLLDPEDNNQEIPIHELHEHGWRIISVYPEDNDLFALCESLNKERDV